MIWIFALFVTLAALTALYYAAGRDKVNIDTGDSYVAGRAHHRAQLSEIAADIESGRLSPEEGEAAKGELAREVIRFEATAKTSETQSTSKSNTLVFAGLALICVLSFGIYVQLGSPQLPAQPIISRAVPQSQEAQSQEAQAQTPQIDVADAVARVEAQLEENPNDARGWAVLGPIYMRQGRFDDAVKAFRQVLLLTPISADAETDLAEAVMMANDGRAIGEPLALLNSAAARDPNHVRSRFYIAGEATRAGDFEDAVQHWQSLLALSTGDEPWVEVARNGLATAEAGLSGNALPSQQTDLNQNMQIVGMVEGLAARLADEGGSIEEWTRLVRSYLVLGDAENAQAAYAAAQLAYPDVTVRNEIDSLAQEAGLKAQ